MRESIQVVANRNLIEDPSFNVEKCYSSASTLEEKVSNTLILLSSIDGVAKIESLLNHLKLQKSNILALYDTVSSAIKSDLINTLENLFETKLNSAKIEKDMDRLLYTIRASTPFSNSRFADQLPQSKEYRQFLALYGENMSLNQKVVQFKSQISLYLDSQKILDKNYASKMAHIDYQIISLSRIISNLSETNKEEIGELYLTQFNRIEALVRDITEREDKFNKLKRVMNLNPESFIYTGFNRDVMEQVSELDSELSKKV
ncbi:hypothetical protein [Candidatus Mycoplasma haematominutum]|uniref:Uncharacterized protein n=1 Tax=Candidatus Mycoplasma haematominutum 'Birmingham 1' TaxID=1116213 RepID=G8C2K6_9MOLU|nr:hypothetical protein [Candidatus Mycoplasma haematominutum]CCE66554.1 hypothetical protein (homolog to MSU_0069) [Candidatus Mycoplasma haematominutum 'Birmingham 1']